MQQLTLDEIKPRLNALLLELKEVFEEHNLTYSLSGGTMLGAVKYKGFIPWDDDIDLFMPREEFNKLVELAREGKLKNILHCNELNKKYKLPFGRYAETATVMKIKGKRTGRVGLHIDIFPVDGMGNDKKMARKKWLKIKRLHRLNYWLCTPLSIKWLWLIPPFTPLFFMQRFIFNRMVKIAKNESYDNSDYVTLRSLHNKLVPKELFAEQTKLEFEGAMYSAPKKYMEYLALKYGANFMEPLPVRKQKNHGYKVFLIDEFS
ncbi:MAG: LicD family protein [Firmicutes bacterium]|nr:LicD family protein [Bacillota bacterium]